MSMDSRNRFDQGELLQIAELFGGNNNIKSVNLISQGSINDTFIACTLDDYLGKFILQRLNRNIFGTPQLLMQNLHLVLNHCADKLKNNKLLPKGRRWQQLEIINTLTNQSKLFNHKSSSWRAFKYINSTLSFSYLSKPQQAYEAGFALSLFHILVNDLDPLLIKAQLPYIHSIESYLIRYDSLIQDIDFSAYPSNIKARIDSFMRFIYSQRNFIASSTSASFSTQLKNQIVHGDPKISNILFDDSSGLAVSLIDLDTVALGIVQFDIADCLRSICNKSGEEPRSLSNVYFDLDFCIKMLKGYYSIYSKFSPSRIELIPECIKLITLELAIRFFVDFLEGNIYFKTSSRYQNLYKAEVQITLLESIESIYYPLIKQIDQI